MITSYKLKRIFFDLTFKAKSMKEKKSKKIRELDLIEKELKVAKKIIHNLQFHGFGVQELIPLNKKVESIKIEVDEIRKNMIWN